jgi:hypothetical protein
MNGLQHKVMDSYLHTLHLHCHAHVLNLVLSQSLNSIEDRSIFFVPEIGLLPKHHVHLRELMPQLNT